jgi:hypothetical protein
MGYSTRKRSGDPENSWDYTIKILYVSIDGIM